MTSPAAASAAIPTSRTSTLTSSLVLLGTMPELRRRDSVLAGSGATEIVP